MGRYEQYKVRVNKSDNKIDIIISCRPYTKEVFYSWGSLEQDDLNKLLPLLIEAQEWIEGKSNTITLISR